MQPATPASNREIDEVLADAERQGLRLALLGRSVALLVAMGWSGIAGNWPQSLPGLGIIVLLLALGLLHLQLIRRRHERPWHRYLLVALDFAILGWLASTQPLLRGEAVPQHLIFRAYGIGYLVIFLALAALSLSPRYVLWVGALAIATVWGIWLATTASLENPLSWTDLPPRPTGEEYIALILSPDFVGRGNRIEESLVLALATLLLAGAVWRARRLVHQRAEAERQRRRALAVFGQYVPAAIAARLAENDGALAPQTREASILFADIQGFTALAERLAPQDLMPLLDGFFSRAGAAVAAAGGVMIAYLGDGFLAAFNVAEDQPRHAAAAVEAAERIIAAELARDFGGRPLALRLGIASGEVAAGVVGGERQAYTVYGDTVNLAQRLEAANKQLGTTLLVSEETWRQAGLGARFRAIGQVELRGRRQPVALYAPAEPR
jgi:adenylate cyclase